MTSQVEDWVTDRLIVVGSSGKEIVAECPWCSRPKLYIRPDRNRFLCFRGCAQGEIASLVAYVDGISYSAAKDKLTSGPRTVAELVEVLSRLRRGERQTTEAPRLPLPSEYVPCYDGKLWRTPKYIDTRNISDASIIRHGIGYALSGRFRDRLIAPVICGEYRAFVARLMGTPASHAWTNREGRKIKPPRYLTPKDSEIGRAVYWGDQIKPGADVAVVEGVFDVVRMVDLGFSAAATLGKRTTVTQLRFLVRSGARSLTWFYDAEALASGIEESAQAAALSSLGSGIKIYVATLPGDYDPDDYGHKFGASGIVDLLSKRVEVGRTLAPLRMALEKLLER